MGLAKPDIGTQLAPGRARPGATGRSLAAGPSGGPEAGGSYAKAALRPVIIRVHAPTGVGDGRGRR
jgi:hypothetical protein